MPSERDVVGRDGEAIADKALRKLGMRILARRFRVTGGELDLICADGRTIVFVEVKTQSDRVLLDPEQRVTRPKRQRMIRAAKNFVMQKRLLDRPLRFDVVTVTLQAAGEPVVEHFPDAFLPDRW